MTTPGSSRPTEREEPSAWELSTASLTIGVAASAASRGTILVASVAAIVAGSMSMAVGEYVSVSSQRDAEQADIEREKRELSGAPHAELDELASTARTPRCAERVAQPSLRGCAVGVRRCLRSTRPRLDVTRGRL